MKKSLHSILTAAMFAAAVTTSLSDPAASAQAKINPAEESLMDETWREQQGAYGPPNWFTETELTEMTTTEPQDVYGPPSWFTEPTDEPASTTTSAETYPEPVYGPPWIFAKKGDMNYDRVLNARDVTQLKRAILTGEFSDAEDYLADVNNDGLIDQEDVKALIRQLTGKPEDGEENAVTTFITNSTDTTTTTVTTPMTYVLYGPPPAY